LGIDAPTPRATRRGGSGIARTATLIAMLSAASLGLGLARDVVTAAVFGAGAEIDSYLVAQGLMNVVLALAAGSLAKAVVPVVAPAAARGDATSAHRSVMGALCIAVVVLGAAAVVIGLVADTLIGALAPGFDSGTRSLTESLTRIVLGATVLIAATNILAALAQSHRRFLWAGSQGVVFNLVMIVAAGAFGPRYGVVALAIGYVVGSLARLVLQLVPLRRIGLRLSATFDPTDPGLRLIARLVPPLLVGSAIGNVNTLVDRAVASLQGEGTIAALSYGWRVASLADTLVVASMVAALYPAFGAAAEDPNRAPLRHLVSRGIVGATLILAPIVVLLVVAAPAGVALIYARGNFTGDDIALTATAVAWYAPALLALAWHEVVVRAFYALGDSRTPVAVAFVAVAVNVAGDLTLGVRFGVPGLAASTVLSLFVGAAGNALLLSRRYAAVAITTVLLSLARLVPGFAAALVATTVVRLALDATLPPPSAAGANALVRLVLMTLAGLCAYGGGVLVAGGEPADLLRAQGARAAAALRRLAGGPDR
jgi:putative peptidoglycan lipid II flippase